MGFDMSDNLVPIMSRTPEERQEIARKGGLKKAENQRRKKRIAEVFEELLSRTDWVRDGSYDWDFAQKTKYDMNFEDDTPLLTELCYRTIRHALAGDMRATALVFKYLDPDD